MNPDSIVPKKLKEAIQNVVTNAFGGVLEAVGQDDQAEWVRSLSPQGERDARQHETRREIGRISVDADTESSR